MDELARVSGRRASPFTMPKGLSRFLAKSFEVASGVMGEKFAALESKIGLDGQTLEMGNHYWFIDWSKAERELGFKPRDHRETLADTVRWLRENAMT